MADKIEHAKEGKKGNGGQKGHFVLSIRSSSHTNSMYSGPVGKELQKILIPKKATFFFLKKKINTLCFSAVSIPPSIKTPLSYLSLPLPSFTLTTIAFALLSLRFWFWVCFFNLYFPPFQFCSWCWACHGNWREVTVNSDSPLV